MTLLDALHRGTYRAGHRAARLWWRLRRPRAVGASVAVWAEGCLLVVRTSYRHRLDLPGGGLRPGEPPRLGAARELGEEVGIVVDPALLEEAAPVAFTEDHRRIREVLFVWRAAASPPLRIDRREIVWAGFVRPGELQGRALSPALRAALKAAPAALTGG